MRRVSPEDAVSYTVKVLGDDPTDTKNLAYNNETEKFEGSVSFEPVFIVIYEEVDGESSVAAGIDLSNTEVTSGDIQFDFEKTDSGDIDATYIIGDEIYEEPDPETVSLPVSIVYNEDLDVTFYNAFGMFSMSKDLTGYVPSGFVYSEPSEYEGISVKNGTYYYIEDGSIMTQKEMFDLMAVVVNKDIGSFKFLNGVYYKNDDTMTGISVFFVEGEMVTGYDGVEGVRGSNDELYDLEGNLDNASEFLFSYESEHEYNGVNYLKYNTEYYNSVTGDVFWRKFIFECTEDEKETYEGNTYYYWNDNWIDENGDDVNRYGLREDSLEGIRNANPDIIPEIHVITEVEIDFDILESELAKLTDLTMLTMSGGGTQLYYMDDVPLDTVTFTGDYYGSGSIDCSSLRHIVVYELNGTGTTMSQMIHDGTGEDITRPNLETVSITNSSGLADQTHVLDNIMHGDNSGGDWVFGYGVCGNPEIYIENSLNSITESGFNNYTLSEELSVNYTFTE